MIFQSKEFNSFSPDEFKKKYSLNSKLLNLKEIFTEVIKDCGIRLLDLDYRGNRFEGWPNNQKRGNYHYDPPIGWIGIGLNVLQKFDNGDDTWIGNNNSEGEWVVGYNGVGYGRKSEEVQRIISKICAVGFKPGPRQMHQDCKDLNHRGKKVGKGIAFSPTIREVEEYYSGISNFNGIKYKTAIMARIKPSAIRACNCNGSYTWIVNGTYDEVRPYRILFKRC